MRIMSNADHINALKSAADPQRVAAALGLHGLGGHYFCPSCQPDGGKTPDLVIKGHWFYCQKCALKGDLLKLIQEAGHLDFPAAVAWLEKETGIPAPDRKRGGKDKGRAKFVYSWSSDEAEAGKKTPDPADPAIYAAFLEACRPVEGRALDWLQGRGIAKEVVAALGLRFCGKEYENIMNALKDRFGEEPLLAAGLLKRWKDGHTMPSFWHYFISRAGFLVIPYMRDGQPVYLKVRPPLSKAEAQGRGLIRFMNTAAAVPCLYNVDALKMKPDRVMVCEGESDTWMALSVGWSAVGTPGAKNFKEAWVEGFGGIEDEKGRSRVYLAMDADDAGIEGTRIIADLFLKAGLPVPLRFVIPWGQDLTGYMMEQTEP
jgi:DNA primase